MEEGAGEAEPDLGCMPFLCLPTVMAAPPPAQGAVPFLESTATFAPSGMTAGLMTVRLRFLGGATRRADMNQLKMHAIAKRARTIPMMTRRET